MKIAFVLDDGLDKPDGVQQYILTLGEWFTNNGHDVRYLVGQTKRTDIPNVYSLAKNVKVRFNGNALSIPLPASTKKIRSVLNTEQFDVIHVQVPYSPFMGAKVIANADPSVAIVGTFHIMPYGVAGSLGTKLLGLWLTRNLRRFNSMVSVSKPAADFAKSHFGVTSTVVPNSVNIKKYAPRTPVSKGNALRVLFLGRLVERKGCRQLLESLALLNQSNRLPDNLQVDICGGGAMQKNLELFVTQNNLKKYVRFHGFVTEAQKIDFMQKADISVFPSTSGESFGIVLIEAMSAGGGIVLAGNNPGYASVLGSLPDSMVDADNPTAMSKQLDVMLHDPSRRAKLSALQQAHVKQFDMAVVARQLLKIYQQF